MLTSLFNWFSGSAQDWANLNRFKVENDSILQQERQEQTVVFMGNSITEGWKTFIPEYFEGNPYINRGIGGQTTPQMLVRFRQDVVLLRPNVVVILAGTNDIAGNTGPASLPEIFGNIASMAEIAQANGIKVVISSVLPAFKYPWKPEIEPAEKIVQLNAMLQAYAVMQGHVYLDYFTNMADEKNGLRDEFTYDGVHPNREGYLVMTSLAEEAIKIALEK